MTDTPEALAAEAASSHARSVAPWAEMAPTALLVLADGTVIEGQGAGATGTAVGEVCFNTAMTGYQEILTDPSYAGQIITFTFPHIGNVGANTEDMETASLAASSGVRGCVMRAAITAPSNWRANQDLDDWLKARGIIAITGVDTRALTVLIREKGMPNAVTGVLTAFEACSPVLVLVARLPTGWIEPDAQVDHDELALMRPICKWARTVHSADRLREYVEVACRKALSGRPGPVVLQVPQEFLSAAVEEAHELDAALTETPKPEASPEAARAAAALLAKARRPMIIADSGAARGNAGEESH